MHTQFYSFHYSYVQRISFQTDNFDPSMWPEQVHSKLQPIPQISRIGVSSSNAI